MAKFDYLTVSLGTHTCKNMATTSDVLHEFAAILPELYRHTCRVMLCGDGKTVRVQQYGITVSHQYGTAKQRGWEYSVQLSGDYWRAIKRNHNAVLEILSGFALWRVSRLDLACDACVPLEKWREYYRAAFVGNFMINGKDDARTVYYGSRKSQFYTRVYNKTAKDPKRYPAPDDFVQVRFEVEIHRVRGDLVLDNAFDSEFTDYLFMQRVHRSAENDSTGFIGQYFATADAGEKIKTVERVLGNLEDTVDYVFKAYAPYISAVMNSQLVADRYDGIEVLNEKGEKILAVLDSELVATDNLEDGPE